MKYARKTLFNYRLQRAYKNTIAVALWRTVLACFGQPVYLMPVRGFRVVTHKHYDDVT